MKAEEHVVRWTEGRLVWKPSRINGNTPCYLYDWFPYDEQTAFLAYPWPSGRGFNVKGAGECTVDASGDGRTVRTQTDYCGGDNEPACPFQALPPGTPVDVMKGLPGSGTLLGTVSTSRTLGPAQGEQLNLTVTDPAVLNGQVTIYVVVRPAASVRECRPGNNTSAAVSTSCIN